MGRSHIKMVRMLMKGITVGNKGEIIHWIHTWTIRPLFAHSVMKDIRAFTRRKLKVLGERRMEGPLICS